MVGPIKSSRERSDKGPGAEKASEGLAKIAENAGGTARRKKGPPPVHLWNPPLSGEIDIRIKRDGSWQYLGTPITREPLARLFGSILRKEDDGRHYLVTPVEKYAITVEDAPFIGVDVDAVGEGREQILEIETNHGDRAPISADHPLRLDFDPDSGEPAPYVLVRGALEARLDRKSFFRLADLVVEESRPEGRRWGVWSCGSFFPLAESDPTG